MENGKQLDKTYSPQSVEKRIYQEWLDGGYFHAEADKSKKPFTIVIPPPNITGQLHIGHAVDNTLQDILIRWKRMEGYSALWMPGTDHASIATEAKIVEALEREGTSKAAIGRDEFLRRAWAWRDLYGGKILGQLKRLGCSCDWERERFTMDDGLSGAVAEVFVRLYGEGLIYKGERIINWCPKCGTSISDIEVEFQERDGYFWHIRYPLADANVVAADVDVTAADGRAKAAAAAAAVCGADGCDCGGGAEYITVATTRPETMLGDTAVAVNPNDPRYAKYVGRKVALPLTGREIPIVADEYVDSEFGTGAVKITPAHDQNDFDVGLRHGLAQIRVMDDHAVMNGNAGAYGGLDRYAARARIVADLEAAGLLEKIEPHVHNVGECSRCHETIEPIISKQWFVKMKPLAEPAIAVVKEGRTRFVPDRFSKTYYHWMENIQDWCISRQLWWGHRIPAYYCDSCGAVEVSRQAPERCPKCGAEGLRQDSDTLDTWFSSALWPFSTMGWPERTPEMEYFYPTDVLVTGYDIIFFWVARMIFSAVKHTGDIPFRHVYIHGLLRDAQGRKMSKSLGNGIDPLEAVDRYGADALRFAITIGNAPGNDMRLSDDKLESARNFTNKLWNAARFALMNLEGGAPSGCGDTGGNAENAGAPAVRAAGAAELGSTASSAQDASSTPSASSAARAAHAEGWLTMADRWIISDFNRLVLDVTDNLEKFELGLALQKVYDFVWDKFCDWYIELAKPRLFDAGAEARDGARYALRTVLSGCMQLLHPFMPFITEEIYMALGAVGTESAGSLGREGADRAAGAERAGAAGEPGSIMVSAWPIYDKALDCKDDTLKMEFVMAVIKGVRNLRSEMNVHPAKKASAVFVTDSPGQIAALTEGRAFIERLASISAFALQGSRGSVAEGSVTLVVEGAEIFMPFGELVDIQKEIERLDKELGKLDREIARALGKLSNEGFTSKAPAAVIAEERGKLSGYEEMREKISENVQRLKQRA